uniref:Uncharacterized protein n=1 Tax=Apteryx owenii TaxID=8824 RepID=A0A8B9P3A1_APTOW
MLMTQVLVTNIGANRMTLQRSRRLKKLEESDAVCQCNSHVNCCTQILFISSLTMHKMQRAGSWKRYASFSGGIVRTTGVLHNSRFYQLGAKFCKMYLES